jgi:DNA polymerase III psi subunit
MDVNPTISQFWGPQVGDPLWEDWVLGRETLVYLDRTVTAELSKVALPSTNLVVILSQTATQEEEALLAKILGALNLSMNQIERHTGPVLVWDSWIQNRLVAFGVPIPPDGPRGPRPESWVGTASLTQMMVDPEAKKNLWQQIKGWKFPES